jgi:hypothetical protein
MIIYRMFPELQRPITKLNNKKTFQHELEGFKL